MQSVNAILSPILSVNLYASYTLYHMKIHSTRLSRFRNTILVSAPTKHDRYQSMLAILANIMLVLRLGQYPRCAPSQSPYIASSMNLWLRDTRSDITPSSGSEFDIRRVHSPREPPASNVPSLFASCLFTPVSQASEASALSANIDKASKSNFAPASRHYALLRMPGETLHAGGILSAVGSKAR